MTLTVHVFLFVLGVKVRRLNEEGASVPVYGTKVSLKAEYDPKVLYYVFVLLYLLFIHLFIYSFIHLFIYSFIHLFIYSFIH